jgi:hypothetical protein
MYFRIESSWQEDCVTNICSPAIIVLATTHIALRTSLISFTIVEDVIGLSERTANLPP